MSSSFLGSYSFFILARKNILAHKKSGIAVLVYLNILEKNIIDENF